MTGSDLQCTSVLGAVWCRLRADHRSAHAARDGAALVSWANPAAGDHARQIVLDWFVEQSVQRAR